VSTPDFRLRAPLPSIPFPLGEAAQERCSAQPALSDVFYGRGEGACRHRLRAGAQAGGVQYGLCGN